MIDGEYMKRIYFDYAASTPVDPDVEKAMRPYFLEKFGNPGSLHSFGQEAIAAVDESRETVAKAIGAPPGGGFREIIFTGSATEANNLALRGAVKSFKFQAPNLKPRIIVSPIEHESILETARDLEREGVEVVYLPVSREGAVDLEKLESALNEQTAIVSIMYANNEVGTIQPISEIAKIISDFRKQIANSKGQRANHSPFAIGSLPLLHTDAVQAFQFLDCEVKKSGVDSMTLSAHKIYGPKGIGALYVKDLEFRSQNLGKEFNLLNPKSHILRPIITGGGQEFGLRSGTENVPLIVGFAKAAELAVNLRESEGKRIGRLRDYFWQELKKIYSRAEINGSEANSECLPNILNVYFPDHKSEDLLTKFDLAGLAVSAGSACRSRAVDGSYVIEALGCPAGRSRGSLRFSFGRPTTKSEVDGALKIIKMSLK